MKRSRVDELRWPVQFQAGKLLYSSVLSRTLDEQAWVVAKETSKENTTNAVNT